jgi:hypothetical protein
MNGFKRRTRDKQKNSCSYLYVLATCCCNPSMEDQTRLTHTWFKDPTIANDTYCMKCSEEYKPLNYDTDDEDQRLGKRNEFRQYQKHILKQLFAELKESSIVDQILLPSFRATDKMGQNSYVFFFQGKSNELGTYETYCIKFIFAQSIRDFQRETYWFSNMNPHDYINHGIISHTIVTNDTENVNIYFPWFLSKRIEYKHHYHPMTEFFHHTTPFIYMLAWIDQLRQCDSFHILHGDIALKNCLFPLVPHTSVSDQETVEKVCACRLIDYGLTLHVSTLTDPNSWRSLVTSFHIMYPRATGNMIRQDMCPYNKSCITIMDAWGIFGLLLDMWCYGNWFQFVQMKPTFQYEDPYVSVLAGYVLALFLNIPKDSYTTSVLAFYDPSEHEAIISYLKKHTIHLHQSLGKLLLDHKQFTSEQYTSITEHVHQLFFLLLEAVDSRVLSSEERFPLMIRWVEHLYQLSSKEETNKK